MISDSHRWPSLSSYHFSSPLLSPPLAQRSFPSPIFLYSRAGGRTPLSPRPNPALFFFEPLHVYKIQVNLLKLEDFTYNYRCPVSHEKVESLAGRGWGGREAAPLQGLGGGVVGREAVPGSQPPLLRLVHGPAPHTPPHLPAPFSHL